MPSETPHYSDKFRSGFIAGVNFFFFFFNDHYRLLGFLLLIYSGQKVSSKYQLLVFLRITVNYWMSNNHKLNDVAHLCKYRRVFVKAFIPVRNSILANIQTSAHPPNHRNTLWKSETRKAFCGYISHHLFAPIQVVLHGALRVCGRT